MPETYGLPDPEPPRFTPALRVLNEVVAGQSTVRTVALYIAAGVFCISPLPVLAIVPLLLLLASDTRLS